MVECYLNELPVVNSRLIFSVWPTTAAPIADDVTDLCGFISISRWPTSTVHERPEAATGFARSVLATRFCRVIIFEPTFIWPVQCEHKFDLHTVAGSNYSAATLLMQ